MGIVSSHKEKQIKMLEKKKKKTKYGNESAYGTALLFSSSAVALCYKRRRISLLWSFTFGWFPQKEEIFKCALKTTIQGDIMCVCILYFYALFGMRDLMMKSVHEKVTNIFYFNLGNNRLFGVKSAICKLSYICNLEKVLFDFSNYIL